MNAHHCQIRFVVLLALLSSLMIVSENMCNRAIAANLPPVADAGSSRYAGTASVQLDGTNSYDPDESGPLTYAWTQVSGPPLVITGPKTATPTISGFVQTDQIQKCEFALVVGDGESTSPASVAEVLIVPSFGASTLRQENPPFDPNKPTVVYFGGGNCYSGSIDLLWLDWYDLANVISFPIGYVQDSVMSHSWHTYYHYGDMLIVFLSSVAPEYSELIQTIGWSTGGQPALDAGIRLNQTYKDPRYSVNHVTELDAPCRWRYQGSNVYASSNALYHTSAVDGEQCWHDHYWGDAYLSGVMSQGVPKDLLCVYLVGYGHAAARDWYKESLKDTRANRFNGGVVAGAYWSVVGPGKNLQLTTENAGYFFRLNINSEMMTLSDQATYPGRLPKPLTLGAWANVSDVPGHVDGVVLSCHESENAVRYQLLLGADPYRVAQYQVISETAIPPMDVIREFPSTETWWTVRVCDQYGSTIYADPIHLDLVNLLPLSVENARTGRRYGLISHAILDGDAGDTIVLDPALYEENIDFDGKRFTIQSRDPNDPGVVAGTIIRGRQGLPTVTFSGPESSRSGLVGLTIQSDSIGISCRDAVPTMRNCIVESPSGIAVEFWHGRRPEFINCTFVGQVREGGDPGLIAYWRLDEAGGMVAHDSEGENDATVMGTLLWQPDGGVTGGALQFGGSGHLVTAEPIRDPSAGPVSVFAWIKGGAPGQVIVSQEGGANWLIASGPNGTLATELKSAGRQSSALSSGAAVVNGNWHRVGFSWDGETRILYVDDIEVARDAQASLAGSTGNVTIGAGSTMTPASFWKGLIDDVRIYSREVKP
jgi:hypothetical protein